MFMPDKFDPKTPLLQAVDTAVVPATTSPVLIRDFFKKNNGVKIATIWDEFRSRYFDKTENPIAEVTYRRFKLLHIAPDGPIIAELGGETKAEGTVTAAVTLLQRQG